MCARQHACVGTPSASMRRSSTCRMAATVSTDSVAGLTPMTASPQPKQQAVDRREQDAGQVVGRVVRLHAHAEARRARPSCCGSG